MSTLTPSDLLTQLHWRYATKKFDPSRRIPPAIWAALEESLLLSPSSFGLQPWKFVIVTDPATKAALVPASWKQTQPVECSHHVVFAAAHDLSTADIDRFIERTVALRGGTAEALAGYRNIMEGARQAMAGQGSLRSWAERQVYIALGNFMTSAAVLGVDACPMEGIVPAEYDRILGLTDSGYTTVVACAAGYRAADDKYATLPKVRFAAAEVIRHV